MMCRDSRVRAFSDTLLVMEMNPHSLNVILTRIREQMRCPLCGTHVHVEFPSVKIAANDFMLLQLRCKSCSAFIVLHVNLTLAGAQLSPPPTSVDGVRNVSSTISVSEDEMKTLRTALERSDGSFEALFKTTMNS